MRLLNIVLAAGAAAGFYFVGTMIAKMILVQLSPLQSFLTHV